MKYIFILLSIALVACNTGNTTETEATETIEETTDSLRLPMEVTHVKRINTISKSPTVVIHPWHYPRHALFILTILSKGPQQKQMIYKH